MAKSKAHTYINALTEDSRLKAVGLTRTVPKSGDGTIVYKDDCVSTKARTGDDIRCFIPDGQFDALPKPMKGDWLAEHKESGQTYKKYISGGAINSPTKRKNTIYLLPMCFKEEVILREVLEPLRQYAEIFFGMPVKSMKGRNMKGQVAERMNDGVYQVHANEVLRVVKNESPGDAFCVAAITMCDIYPREEWNFVFGLAQLSGGCGVYSLARYLSNFGDGSYTQMDLERDPIESVMLRACKTMCHEIGHMFGLKHCIYYTCLMNGSNHQTESDSKPVFVCPVCLRKLHHVCKFDIVQRYVAMKDFWSNHQFTQQTEWLDGRLSKLATALT